MGQFHCRVADAEGRVFSHVEPASSQEEARQKLVDRGLYVYSVESRGGRLAGLVRQKSGRQIGGSEFLILNQQFNTLIKAGLPILKSLDLLASRATSPKLRPVITQIRDRVREGKSLSEAVAEAGVFSKAQRCDRYRDLFGYRGDSKVWFALPRPERGAPRAHAIVDCLDCRLSVCCSWSRRVDGGDGSRSFSLVPYRRRWNGFRSFQVPSTSDW
ncbi:MAG: hypothetical protein DMG51_15270 [Acidobacteria bacterium]|nr:MAG: hypothetical protein DMG51_15270 [Acidobacteriota bacterium]